MALGAGASSTGGTAAVWLLGEAYACDQEEKGQEPGMSNASARLGHDASDSELRLGLGADL